MRTARNDSEGHYGAFLLKGEPQSLAAEGCRGCMWTDAKNARVRDCVPQREVWMLFITGWQQLFWLLIFSSNCFDQTEFYKRLYVPLSDLYTSKFQRMSWRTKGSRNQTTPPTNFLTGTCLLQTKTPTVHPPLQTGHPWLIDNEFKGQSPRKPEPPRFNNRDPLTVSHSDSSQPATDWIWALLRVPEPGTQLMFTYTPWVHRVLSALFLLG